MSGFVTIATESRERKYLLPSCTHSFLQGSTAPVHSRQNSTCVHSRQNSTCVHSRQNSTCVHSRQNSTCVNSRQNSTCVHSRQNSTCVHSRQVTKYVTALTQLPLGHGRLTTAAQGLRSTPSDTPYHRM